MKTKFYLTLLLACLAGLNAACGRATAYEKPLTPVRVQAAQQYWPNGAGSGLRYSATIKPAAQFDLAFKSGGYVREWLQVRGADGRWRDLQEGDRVAKGATLARLREDDFAVKVQGAAAQVTEAQSARATNQAQVSEAEAALQLAQRDLDRATALLESGSLTRPEYDAAKTERDVAQAKLAAAQAQGRVLEAKISGAQALLAESELARRDAVLRAPSASVVLRRAVEAGSLVAAGTPVITLAAADSAKVVFGVPDLAVPSLKPGATLSLTTEVFPGVELQSVITRIAATADPRTRLFEVEATILHPPAELKAGMIGTIVLPNSNAVAVPIIVAPLSAVVRSQTERDAYAVFIISTEQGQAVARRRTVKLGEAYGNQIAIIEGVQLGEQLIISGATLLADGEPVQVMQ
jgi:RND family efflux transporter MFP subunit